MRGRNRALIAAGTVLIALVVIGLVAGAAQDAQFGQKSDQSSFGPIDVVALLLGALLVLVGVIQHQGDQRRSDRD